MTKLDFLLKLHEALGDLPQDEVKERLRFYSEMIEDRMEDGLPEEEAVLGIGTVEEVAAQIRAEVPLAKTAEEKIERKRQKRRLHGWEIILLILGSPLWLTLLLSAFAVILSLYVSLWAVVISLWAVFVSVAVCAAAGVLAGLWFALFGNRLTGIAMLGGGAVCTGLAMFLFYGCKAVTGGIGRCSLQAMKRMKKRLTGRETI